MISWYRDGRLSQISCLQCFAMYESLLDDALMESQADCTQYMY